MYLTTSSTIFHWVNYSSDEHYAVLSAIETGLNGNGPKWNPTERDIDTVNVVLKLFFHENPPIPPNCLNLY